MPKIKTRKTAAKRIKITGTGKIVKKAICNGHLKIKRSANRKFRSKATRIQENKGHRKMFKKLLPGSKIK